MEYNENPGMFTFDMPAGQPEGAADGVQGKAVEAAAVEAEQPKEESDGIVFDQPKGQSAYIKVIGVGGGGGNAVNHMYRQGIEGVDFIVCNTDMKALGASPVPNKIQLGALGLGAGNKPEKARRAAEAQSDKIREALSHNTQMLFITAGMGGGTGTGAAPVVAEIAKSIDLENEENKKILVVAIVTRPFSFEGKRRRVQAEQGIEDLRKHVDSIIVINNDKLLTDGKMGFSSSFAKADDVLLTAAKGIAEIITQDAYINRDFQDINTVMEQSGTALMGTGSGRGENRAHDAIEAAATSVLLDDSDIRGAKNVLLYFTYSMEHEMTMDELEDITNYVLDKTDGTADLIWGAGPDESLGDELKVILVATGFEKNMDKEGDVIVFDDDKKVEASDEKKEPEKRILTDDGMTVLLHPEEPVAADKASVKGAVRDVMEAEEMQLIQKEPEAASVADKKPVEPLVPEVPVINVTPAETLEPTVQRQKPDVAMQPEAAKKPQDDINIIVWHDDEEEVAAAPAGRRNLRAGGDEFRTEIDATVGDDIKLVEAVSDRDDSEPAGQLSGQPVAVEPAYRPAPEDSRHAQDKIDFMAMDRMERIRHMNELLRNNPQGGEIVQKMTMAQLNGEEPFEGLPSSVSEVSKHTMKAGGAMTENTYLFAKAD